MRKCNTDFVTEENLLNIILEYTLEIEPTYEDDEEPFVVDSWCVFSHKEGGRWYEDACLLTAVYHCVRAAKDGE